MTLAVGTHAAGGIGFLIVLALLVAGYFLFRSMNKQLKRIPPSYDDPRASQAHEAQQPTPPAAAEARTPDPAAEALPRRGGDTAERPAVRDEPKP